MAYTYSTLKTALALHMVVDETDPDFVSVLPNMIEAAELRIYRELDPIWCRKTWQGNFNESGTVSDNAILDPPTDLLIPREMWFYPSGIAGPVRQVIERREETFLNEYWPDRSVTGTPRYYALIGGDWNSLVPQTIVVSPTPDQPYLVTISGTFRPPTLSEANPSTYLAQRYPDLLLYACLVFAAGYQRNYGAQSDDPQQAMSWERQYQMALTAGKPEESRRKSRSWSERASPSAAPAAS